MKQKKLIVIVGATAIGKTNLSIKLAKHFNTEILSSDSRQFYKEMNIGTAVPSFEELKQIKHHFIQNRSIFDAYNVGNFEEDAIALLNKKFQNNDWMVMVGGSGLYSDAVTDGLDDFPKVDPGIRSELKLSLKDNGIEHLQKKLFELDPVTHQRIDIFNKQRLIRALEICLGSDHPFSYYWSAIKKNRDFQTIKIGLEADRTIIYDRINQRVDQMIEKGLLEEAKALYPNKHLNALQTVGYRELFNHFDGTITLEDAISEIKKNTRRFAKRQGTWYRKDDKINWFDFQTETKKIISFVETVSDRIDS